LKQILVNNQPLVERAEEDIISTSEPLKMSLKLCCVQVMSLLVFLSSSLVKCEVVQESVFPRRLEAEDFPYYNPNDTYSPSIYVKYGHQLSGMEFGTDMKYLQRVSYAPIGLFALGFLSIFFLDWGLLFRCCCNCCKCEPKRNDEFYARNRTCNYVWFYILCFLVLVFDQLVFIGNTNVDSGVTTTRDTIDAAVNIVDVLYLESYALGEKKYCHLFKF
jgi:hypothetical protein